MHQQQIHIPQRRDDDPPATAQQLKHIRQLVQGQSLQGYRFDYIKLSNTQAQAIIHQLTKMTEHTNTTPKNRKQAPGCISQIVRSTTALVVWIIVLAGVAGGAYLIYWRVTQAPEQPKTANQQPAEDLTSDDQTQNQSTRPSTIFHGLNASDNTPTQPSTTNPTPTQPTITPPNPTINTPTNPSPAPTPDPLLAQQRSDLLELLVKLSQYTRSDFAPSIRDQSSQAMHNKLDTLTSLLNTLDPALTKRIRDAVTAFASPQLDSQALRDEIKAIRQALEPAP